MIVVTMFVAGIQFLNIANYANILIVLVVLNKRWMHFYCFIPISIVGISVLSSTNFVKHLICQRFSRKSDCTCHYFFHITLASSQFLVLHIWTKNYCNYEKLHTTTMVL
jgi:hypothetical protein